MSAATRFASAMTASLSVAFVRRVRARRALVNGRRRDRHGRDRCAEIGLWQTAFLTGAGLQKLLDMNGVGSFNSCERKHEEYHRDC